MACPMVLAHRNEDVLVDVEWSGETLCKDVHYVVVAIRAVIEFDAKRVLPFLRFENMIRVRGVENETFEIELAHSSQFWPRLEGHIGIITNAVVAFQEADFRIEVGTDLTML